MPHPKDDMHRPVEILLLWVYAENEPRTDFSIIFLSRKPNISKIRGDEFFDLYSNNQNF